MNSIAIGGGSVWITDDTGGMLWRIKTDLSSVSSTPVRSRPDDVTYAEGSVWVANFGDASISKVDPGLLQVTADYPVGIQPSAIAVADGKVWVAGFLLGTNAG